MVLKLVVMEITKQHEQWYLVISVMKVIFKSNQMLLIQQYYVIRLLLMIQVQILEKVEM